VRSSVNPQFRTISYDRDAAIPFGKPSTVENSVADLVSHKYGEEASKRAIMMQFMEQEIVRLMVILSSPLEKT